MRNKFQRINPDIIDKTTHTRRVEVGKVLLVPDIKECNAKYTLLNNFYHFNERDIAKYPIPYYRVPTEENKLLTKFWLDNAEDDRYIYAPEANLHFQGHVYFDTVAHYSRKATDVFLPDPVWEVPDEEPFYIHCYAGRETVRLKVRNTKFPYYRAIVKENPTPNAKLVEGWVLSKKLDHHSTGGGIISKSKAEKNPQLTIYTTWVYGTST
jgi:hypothetical protein